MDLGSINGSPLFSVGVMTSFFIIYNLYLIFSNSASAIPTTKRAPEGRKIGTNPLGSDAEDYRAGMRRAAGNNHRHE
jgi:hypothetical protein